MKFSSDFWFIHKNHNHMSCVNNIKIMILTMRQKVLSHFHDKFLTHRNFSQPGIIKNKKEENSHEQYKNLPEDEKTAS